MNKFSTVEKTVLMPAEILNELNKTCSPQYFAKIQPTEKATLKRLPHRKKITNPINLYKLVNQFWDLFKKEFHLDYSESDFEPIYWLLLNNFRYHIAKNFLQNEVAKTQTADILDIHKSTLSISYNRVLGTLNGRVYGDDISNMEFFTIYHKTERYIDNYFENNIKQWIKR